jgi:hypothetical protein
MELINIAFIKVNAKQLKKLDLHKVEQHARSYELGEEVFPIDLVRIGPDEYCISGNGRHRYFGAVQAGVKFIEANVLNLVL